MNSICRASAPLAVLLLATPAFADTVLIDAHRGGYANEIADKAPENSVANVAVAVAKGFDLFETHSYDPAQWKELASAGGRMFHTTLPGETLAWRRDEGWREQVF